MKLLFLQSLSQHPHELLYTVTQWFGAEATALEYPVSLSQLSSIKGKKAQKA